MKTMQEIETMTPTQVEQELNNYQIIKAQAWANQSRNAKVSLAGYNRLTSMTNRVHVARSGHLVNA